MKKYYLFAFSLILLVAAARDRIEPMPKWGGKTQKENDILIVENSGPGLYGKNIDKKIQFEEVLSLGTDSGNGPEYLMFGRHVMIDTNAQKDIFVLDVQNYRLMKFDSSGRFLWKAGRKGQGPGEIEAPFSLTSSDDGGVLVLDQSGKIHYFGQDGKFKNMVKLEKEIKSIISYDQGRIFANLWKRGRPNVTAAAFSQEGKLISQFPIEYYYGPELSPRRAYDLGGAFRLHNGELFLSLPDKYEIRAYSLEGKLLKRIMRDVRIRPPVLENGYEFVVNDVSGPCDLLPNGYLINRLSLKVKKDEESEIICLDIFNENYKFLGSYPLQESTYLAKIDRFGNFYFIQTDPYIKLSKKTMKIV